MSSVKEKLQADNNILCVSEFIENTLLFATLKERKALDVPGVRTFGMISYNPTLGSIAQFIDDITSSLQAAISESTVLVSYTLCHDVERVHAAFLMGVFAISRFQMNPVDAYSKLGYMTLDAAVMDKSPFNVRLLDYLGAVYKATSAGLVDFDDFDQFDYEEDWGFKMWVVPKKILVFTVDYREIILPETIASNISTLVRLDNMTGAEMCNYHGLKHCVFSCIEGNTPSMKAIDQFIKDTDDTSGAIAFCFQEEKQYEACLVLAYLVKHYRMTSLEAYAWLRLCMPDPFVDHSTRLVQEDGNYNHQIFGNIQSDRSHRNLDPRHNLLGPRHNLLGPRHNLLGRRNNLQDLPHSHQWLDQLEHYLWYMGHATSLQRFGDGGRIEHHEYGVYSLKDKPESPTDDSGVWANVWDVAPAVQGVSN